MLSRSPNLRAGGAPASPASTTAHDRTRPPEIVAASPAQPDAASGRATPLAVLKERRDAVKALADSAAQGIRRAQLKPGLLADADWPKKQAERLDSTRRQLLALQASGLDQTTPPPTLARQAKTAAEMAAAYAGRIPAGLAAGAVGLGVGAAVAVGVPVMSLCCTYTVDNGKDSFSDGRPGQTEKVYGGVNGIIHTPQYVVAAVAGERSLPRKLFRKLDPAPATLAHARLRKMSTDRIAQTTIAALDAAIAKLQ